MSIILEIRGESIGAWPLTSRCIAEIEQLRATVARPSVEVLFGAKSNQLGTVRKASRIDLLRSAEALTSFANGLSPGFEMLITSFSDEPLTGQMMSDLVGGKSYVFRCERDYWTMQPTDEMAKGIPAERRTEPAEFISDLGGTIKIVRQKPGGTHIAQLLKKIKTYVKDDTTEEFTVVVG